MAKIIVVIASFFAVMFVGQFLSSSVSTDPVEREYNTDSTLRSYGRWAKQIDSCNYQLILRLKTIN